MSSCDLLEHLKDDMEVDFKQEDLPKQTVVWKPISLFSMQSEGFFFSGFLYILMLVRKEENFLYVHAWLTCKQARWHSRGPVTLSICHHHWSTQNGPKHGPLYVSLVGCPAPWLPLPRHKHEEYAQKIGLLNPQEFLCQPCRIVLTSTPTTTWNLNQPSEDHNNLVMIYIRVVQTRNLKGWKSNLAKLSTINWKFKSKVHDLGVLDCPCGLIQEV